MPGRLQSTGSQKSRTQLSNQTATRGEISKETQWRRKSWQLCLSCPHHLLATSFERAYARTVVLIASDPTAGHHRPTPLLETPGPSWASLGQPSVGSLLLSPGSWSTQGFVCALQESVSQSRVSSGGCMVLLMVTSSKRVYAVPRSTSPRAPAPAAVHC